MSSSTSRKTLQAVIAIVVALGVATASLGLPILALVAPPYTRFAEPRFSSAEDLGLTTRQQADAAEVVRRFVADPDAPEPPERVAGRPAFDAAAVSHLRDVQRVVAAGRAATLFAVLAFALAAFAAVRLRLRRSLGLGMVAGAIGLALLVVAAAIFALADFDSFFAAFHSLFFAAGTWVFPYDSLLIGLFPEAFWAFSGGAWAVLSTLLAVASAVVGGRIGRNRD